MNVTWLVIWFMAVIVFAVIEILTIQLTSIWLAVGAVAGMAACTFGAPLYVQLLVFAVVSLILLAVTRPFVKKFIKMKEVKMNAGRLIGMTAVVTEDICNEKAQGAVKISGVTWTARSEDGSDIAAGEKVTINKIEGSKLIVTSM